MKRIAPLLFWLLSCHCAFAQAIFAFGPAPSNIYALTYTPAIQPWFSDTTGKIIAPSAIAGGQSTLVLLVISQSIAADSAPTPYVPTNQLAHALSILDGNVYRASDPLLGSTGQPPSGTTYGGSYLSRLADNIISHGKFTRVILVPGATIGSTSVNDWSPAGPWNGRLRVTMLRIRSQAWIGNPNVTFRAIYDQGQADVSNGTSQAAWQASFAQVITTVNSFGLGAPKVCVPQDTMLSNATSATIRAAQAAVVDNVQIFSGGDFDTLTGSNRQADGTHPSDVGVANMASIIESCVAP